MCAGSNENSPAKVLCWMCFAKTRCDLSRPKCSRYTAKQLLCQYTASSEGARLQDGCDTHNSHQSEEYDDIKPTNFLLSVEQRLPHNSLPNGYRFPSLDDLNPNLLRTLEKDTLMMQVENTFLYQSSNPKSSSRHIRHIFTMPSSYHLSFIIGWTNFNLILTLFIRCIFPQYHHALLKTLISLLKSAIFSRAVTDERRKF
jgi:hypothetical protein